MAQFLQTSLGQSPLDAGLRLIPWTGTVFIVSPIAGALVDRIGERPLLVGGLLLQAVGFTWVALLARAGLPYSEMVAPLILAGTGISSALPAAQNAVMSAVAPGEIGKASGTFSTMRQLGGAFGLAIAVRVQPGGELRLADRVQRRIRARDRRVGGAIAVRGVRWRVDADPAPRPGRGRARGVGVS